MDGTTDAHCYLVGVESKAEGRNCILWVVTITGTLIFCLLLLLQDFNHFYAFPQQTVPLIRLGRDFEETVLVAHLSPLTCWYNISSFSGWYSRPTSVYSWSCHQFVFQTRWYDSSFTTNKPSGHLRYHKYTWLLWKDKTFFISLFSILFLMQRISGFSSKFICALPTFWF